ncbi:RICIN domain-containing protein [Hymenobacter weizhouensis]|uniref:RICIN domain-containing protein n=1 Tax=Hymenobacter sp. YIM 151500-1 TaxID=2987689 RepID=UPI002225B8C7|nr:RICIN domain-containing protein [Hymenobacter sp. YIM 151500-1]UYZ62508.1 RICIN domain-containing protein [Hymenobacter sp. YIM 151500-1]
MKTTQLLSGLLLALAPWLGGPAQAQTTGPCPNPAPTDMAGAVQFGNGTPGSCTQAALQTLINAGGKIQCNCGPDPFTLTLTSTLTVPNKEVILDGAGKVTISGNNAVRIFRKEPAVNQAGGTLLGLQNIKLINGRISTPADGSDLGGAALASRGAFGSLRIINVRFENNQTVFPNSAINPGNNISVNADACGAVHTILYKEAVFANCTFVGNKGANGGAVGTIGTAQRFINCVFEGNEATGTGGTFDKGGSGGAVYVDGIDQNGVNNSMSLCGTVFRNNKSGHQGGALNVVFYAGKGSTNSVDRCAFENNSCGPDMGGAFYHMNGPLTLTNSTFANNTTGGTGGGVWMTNTTLTLSNATFAGNTAANLGGGLAYDGSGPDKTATITNCTFAGNRGGNFASALMNGGNTTLVNNLFYNNLTGTQYQSNSYGGGTINKGSGLTVGAGNLQWPETYAAQYGPQREDWLTSAVLVADARLQPLAENGGFTKTMALPTGSPAINAGTASGAPATDQRGYARVGNPDIGAFEVSTVTSTSPPPPSPATFSGVYTLTARHSGQRLNVSGASTATGADVIQWPTSTGAANEQWTVTAVGNGYYTLTAVHSGKCLDVSGASSANGARVQQWDCNNTGAQRWQIVATTDGYYKLLNQASGKALDVSGVSQANGALVHQWEYVGGLNQQWRLDPVAGQSQNRARPAELPAADVVVYPNPASGTAKISFRNPGTAPGRLTLLDGVGRQVRVYALPTSRPGQWHEQQVQLGELPAGLYSLRLELGQHVAVRKLRVE